MVSDGDTVDHKVIEEPDFKKAWSVKLPNHQVCLKREMQENAEKI